jgi:hypothetical protein
MREEQLQALLIKKKSTAISSTAYLVTVFSFKMNQMFRAFDSYSRE